MRIRYFETPGYLRITRASDSWTGERPIAAIRRKDGRCFVDSAEDYRKLVEHYGGSPFAALFPDAIAATIGQYESPRYLRLYYTFPGDLCRRPLAAQRRSDGRVFVDDIALFELLCARYGDDPFAVLFRANHSTSSSNDPDEADPDAAELAGQTDGNPNALHSLDPLEGELPDNVDADDPFEDDADYREWLEDVESELEGWHEDLLEAQGDEAYWQDADYYG